MTGASFYLTLAVLLLLIAVLGGGFEFAQFRFPAEIGWKARTASALLAFFFASLGLADHRPSLNGPDDSPNVNITHIHPPSSPHDLSGAWVDQQQNTFRFTPMGHRALSVSLTVPSGGYSMAEGTVDGNNIS